MLMCQPNYTFLRLYSSPVGYVAFILFLTELLWLTTQSANKVLVEAMMSRSTSVPGNLRKHIVVIGYDSHCIAQYVHAFRKLEPHVSGFTYV